MSVSKPRIERRFVAVNNFGTKWPKEFVDDPLFGTKRPRIAGQSWAWLSLSASRQCVSRECRMLFGNIAHRLCLRYSSSAGLMLLGHDDTLLSPSVVNKSELPKECHMKNAFGTLV